MEKQSTYTAYNATTGAIGGTVSLYGFMELDFINLPDTGLHRGGLDGRTTYIDISNPDQHIPVPRPAMGIAIDKTEIAADGVDVATVSGIPDGAKILLRNDESTLTADGTSFEFTSDSEGDFIFFVTLFPYINEEFVINAT